MRELLAAIALSLCFAQPAGAVIGTAVAWRDGPSGGRFVGPIWMMNCPAGQRLAGVRVHEDKRIAGIQAICAGTLEGDRVKWSGKPAIPNSPRIKRRSSEVVFVDDEARVMDGGDRELKDGDAERVVIVEESDWASVQEPELPHSPVGYDDAAPDAIAVDTQAVYRPADRQAIGPLSEENAFETSYARATWGSTKYLWRYSGGVYRGAVDFKKVRGSYDLTCPANHFVTGIRTGWRRQAEQENLTALQIVCGAPGQRALSAVGSWPRETKKGHSGIRMRRSDCSGSITNPHDGDVVQAIFGSIESGRVQSVGVSCAKWPTPEERHRANAAS
jgi:hypothetical protein